MNIERAAVGTLIAVCAVLASTVAAAPALAVQYERDPRFRSSLILANDDMEIVSRALAVEADGGVLIAGSRRRTIVSRSEPFVARRDAKGRRDSQFGEGGFAYSPMDDRGPIRGSASELALQTDGRVVVAGGGRVAGRNVPILFRLLPDGKPDPTFSPDHEVGSTTTEAHFWDVEIQDDGRIVVAGEVLGPGDQRGAAIWRFHPDGKVDRSFGEDGRRFVRRSPTRGFTAAYTLALTRTGHILAAGSSRRVPFLVGLNAVGDFARGFGKRGRVRVWPGSRMQCVIRKACSVEELTLLPDGRIRVLANRQVTRRRINTYYPNLLGFRADGRPDRSVGGSGRHEMNFFGENPWGAYTMAPLPGGRLVVGGSDRFGNRSVTRYVRPNGRIDARLGFRGDARTRGESVDDIVSVPGGDFYVLATDGFYYSYVTRYRRIP